ncbi:Hypothetical protein SMAX5B_015866 [Scophthalmus maximus]|uniref:C2H2-type domain-containing protein n=2 Tax=Scophthalmus maximus TaxID=52904 RepID=A0A2U9CZX4_SCOMX|nr:Hypothetical protein SMAX5B_015866 [Scophthalmus maximus]
MDKFETPYDVEADFIECTVCEKSIRGETLYKIHLTTPGHRKKEESFVTAGLAVRKQSILEFKDILQYLDYLKLDEPIIGLSCLEEVPSTDPQAGLRYSCRLCHLISNLPEMVHHLIGRKHRQKYMEVNRPDLVTWDKQAILNQGGKIIRARAEIIERQDGRGNPAPLAKRGNEGNTSRVPSRQKQNRNQNIAKSLTQHNIPPLIPKQKDYGDEYSDRGRYPPMYPNAPPFNPDEPYVSRDRQTYQQQDSLSGAHVEEDQRSADYRDSNMYRREYKDPDNCLEYEEEYVEEPQGRATHEPGGAARYDPWEEEQVPHGQSQQEEYYPEEAPPYRRPQPKRDPLKEFYSEEVRRRQVRSEQEPSQPVYREDKRQWSLDRESGRHDGMNTASRPGSSEPEAKSRRFPTPMESDRSHLPLFNFIKDYQHRMRDPCKEVTVSNSGPSRTGAPSSHRRMEVTKTMSDIPEPFMRFLTGAANDEEHGKRKRKSRFSDATAEEVEMTKEIFTDDYEPPNPKYGGHHRPGALPLRPEIHAPQHPDLYTESQNLHHTESYHREIPGSEGVFDMLKGIDIENAEEADFLKKKLCSLLKEFKSKKSEKTMQNSQDGAVLRNDYNSLKPDTPLFPRHQYERTLTEDSDRRRPQDLHFKDDLRGPGWKQHEFIPDERPQDYHQSAGREPGHSNRSRYEEAFGCPGKSQSPRVSYSNEPHHTERFQAPMRPHGYRPAAEEYFVSHSPSTPLRMVDEPRMHRGPRYSNNLDKITSTLLELVSRK